MKRFSFILALGLPAQLAFGGGEPVLKIRTAESGLHRLAVQSIVDAGADAASLDPKRLNLYYKGEPVPIAFYRDPGESLDADNGILFHGSWQESEQFSRDRWDDRRAYFLHANDEAPVRFATAGAPSNPPAPEIEPGVLHRRTHFERAYISPYFNDDEKDPFDFFATMFFRTGQQAVDYPLAAPGLDRRAESATLSLRFYGRSALPANPDHLFALSIGGTPAGDVSFDGITGHLHVQRIPVTSATEDRFDLRVEMKPSSPGAGDVAFLDWMRVDYPARAVSAGNQVDVFAVCPEDADYAATVSIERLPSKYVRIFDIGQGIEYRPELRAAADGTVEATFEARISAKARIVASPDGGLLAPVEVSAFAPRDMAAEAAQAELAIVAPPEFARDAARLAEHRRTQGMAACVAIVRDVYDNYGAGHKSPQAIRDFLREAHGRPGSRLRYVLLAGSASQDPKQQDMRTKDNPDYVPTMHYGSSRFAPFAWDNYFVAFGEDGETPDLAVGRIPARTPAEFADVVDKIVAYESFESPEWMNDHVLLCSVEQALIDAVERTAKIVAERNPQATFERIYADPKLEDTIYAPQAVAAIDRGSGLVIFNGHGASHRWGQGPIGREPRRFLFDLQAVNELKNQNRFPIVMAATCYTNGFDDAAGGETIGHFTLDVVRIN